MEKNDIIWYEGSLASMFRRVSSDENLLEESRSPESWYYDAMLLDHRTRSSRNRAEGTGIERIRSVDQQRTPTSTSPFGW